MILKRWEIKGSFCREREKREREKERDGERRRTSVTGESEL